MAAPHWNLCVGKPIGGDGKKRKFTQVGAGWNTESGNGIKFQLDLTVILSPSDELYVLKNKEAAPKPDSEF